MALDPSQRIAMIQEIAMGLGQKDWAEIDLILEQFGFMTGSWSDWADAPMKDYVLTMVKDGSDDRLVALHRYIAEQVQTAAVTSGPWHPGRLHLFMIHLASEREFVGSVRRRLERFGVDAFVAHDSIEPSHEWVDVIDAALRTCHAAVAFLHEGFGESAWTDQEVGFCLARRVPVLPLTFGLLPKGFLARFQAAKCRGMDEATIVKAILERARSYRTRSSSIACSWARRVARPETNAVTSPPASMLPNTSTVRPQSMGLLKRSARFRPVASE